MNQAEAAFDRTPFQQEIRGQEAQVKESEEIRSRGLLEMAPLEKAQVKASHQASEAETPSCQADESTKGASRKVKIVHDEMAQVNCKSRQRHTEHIQAQEKVFMPTRIWEWQHGRYGNGNMADFLAQARSTGGFP